MAHSPAHGARLSASAAYQQTAREPSRKGALFLCLLGVQFGLQPLLARKCTAPETIKSVVVLSTDGVKVVLALVMLAFEDRATRAAILGAWTLADSLTYAAVPAALYALQNWLCQLAYQQLDSLTYNLLNQTKTLSAALNLYLFLGRRQSATQVFALGLLLTSAAMLTMPKPDDADASAPSGASTVRGVVPVLVASFLSGVSATLTQWALQRRKRNSYLYSLELSLIGMGTVVAANVGGWTPDAALIRERGLFAGWTPASWLPVVSNAIGGILVGLVTKHSGGVRKGFALIGGIVLTTVAQSFVEGIPLTRQHYAAAALVAIATWLHSSFPSAVASRRASDLSIDTKRE